MQSATPVPAPQDAGSSVQAADWLWGWITENWIALLALILTALAVKYARRGAATGAATLAQQERDSKDARQAILEIPPDRTPIGSFGGGIKVGEVQWHEPGRGHTFLGYVQNIGPHAARDVRLTARLGGQELVVTEPLPPALMPHSDPERFELLYRFKEADSDPYAAVLMMLRQGELMRVQVAFTDGNPTRDPFSRCFRFERVGEGIWASHLTPCEGAVLAAR